MAEYDFPKGRVIGGGAGGPAILRAGGLLIILFLVVIFLFSAMAQVDAGTVAVLTLFGKVQPNILDPGIHLRTLRVEICREDGYEPDRELADKMFAEGMKGDLDARGRRMGLVLDIGGYYKNVFTLAPCFRMTEEEIDISVELLEQLIRRCAPERV